MVFPFHPQLMIWTPLIRKSLRAAQRQSKFPWNPKTIESYPYPIWATSGQGCPASSWPQNFIFKVIKLPVNCCEIDLWNSDSFYMYDFKTSYKGQPSKYGKSCICLVSNKKEWSLTSRIYVQGHGNSSVIELTVNLKYLFISNIYIFSMHETL